MNIKEGLTFDDVLLIPKYSEVLPYKTRINTRFTRHINLNIPLVSAAMDTVTEVAMSIAIARMGGIGVIHKNMGIEEQINEVIKVKRAESGVITNPYTLTPDKTLKDALKIMERYNISGLPVVDESKRAVGIVTRRDVLFVDDLTISVEKLMTKKRLITAQEGVDMREAQKILKENRIEKLLIVDKDGVLKGLITAKDIQHKLEHPEATLDERGRLRVAAAVGVGFYEEDRAMALKEAGVDVIIVDTAHAHSKSVIDFIINIKKKIDSVDIVVGNIATYEAAMIIKELDVDAIKVGVGPGSICTTRVVAGIGVPQISAIMEVSKALKDSDIPLIADGGIRFSGDIVKAIAAGADSVMIGNLFAGTDESPGESILLEGRRYKIYRGMGSEAAMKKGSADRYFQDEAKKFVPEGIEGIVPYKGPVKDVIYQLIGGLRSGMGYVGAKDLKMLRDKAEFYKITNAGLKESHPHDVRITREPPNYEIFR